MILDPIIADHANAFFEALGTFFIGRSVFKVIKDKMVRGIAWEQVAFWTIWGYWNIYYYWAVGSSWSWWAGCGVTVANTIYTSLLIYYTFNEKKQRASSFRNLPPAIQKMVREGTMPIMDVAKGDSNGYDRRVPRHPRAGKREGS